MRLLTFFCLILLGPGSRALAKGECAGGGLFLMPGVERAQVSGDQPQQMTAVGGVLARPVFCTEMTTRSYVLGVNFEGTYAFGKFRQPSFSVKAAGLGPTLCYWTKSGTGFCGMGLGQLLQVKNGATFIVFSVKKEISAQFQMSTNTAFRLSVSEITYPLTFATVRQVEDITVLAGIGIVPALSR